MLRFLRNPEIYRLVLVMLLLGAVMTAAGFALSADTGWAVLAASLVMTAASAVFQFVKYRKIVALSRYLRRIAAGEYDLDLRDNTEGELSILKSELHKVTVKLREINEQLRAERTVLADAMSDISHQLKTPLTSMMVMADLLADDSLPLDKRREFTDQIVNQLERIRWLVSSLLKFSKLDIGAAELKREPVPVCELVAQATRPLLVPIREKNQTLVAEGEDNAVFTGDMAWSAEALLNIVKNCMEHTPSGGQVSIAWRDNPIFTEIRVSDTGEGIAREDIPHIFTRYYRGKNASEDSVGIGLAMAKSIMEKQNGSISVISERGKGSTFTIQIYKAVV